MAKAPTLNLTPELPEVRSEDFNLFYRPEAEPLPQGLKDFANSLDRFVNDGLVDAYVVNEKKKKKEGEAEAEKDVRMGKKIDTEKEVEKNKLGFFKKTSSGEFPKEANPYYLDKYKELTLNTKADEFKRQVSIKYAEKQVMDNPSPTAFQDFYKEELKEFISNNQLGSYDAVMLEKGFFSKTSGMKTELYNNHIKGQMGRINEEFDTNFKNNIQGFFDKTKTLEENGKGITEFFEGYDNILSNGKKRKLFFDALTDYAQNTSDLEYAEKVISGISNYVKLGKGQTDFLGKITGLQDDFDKIKEGVQNRIEQEEKDLITKKSNAETLENFEVTDYVNEFETFTDAKNDPRFKDFENTKQKKIFDKFEKLEIGFDSQTDPRVEKEMRRLLKLGKYDEAIEYIDENIPNIKQTDYPKFIKEVQSFKFTEKDGLLSSDYFNFFKDEIETYTDKIQKGKFNTTNFSALEHEKFEATIRKWLSTNDLEKYNGDEQAREKDFDNYVKEEFNKVKERALSSGITTTDGTTSNVTIEEGSDNTPIIVNEKDLPKAKKTKKEIRNPEIKDKDLEINLDEAVVIPASLSGTSLRKFLRDNPDAITQERFLEIQNKQKLTVAEKPEE